MEALNFIRFWKPSNGGDRQNRAQPCRGNKNNNTTLVPKAFDASDHELDEGEDFFFDLKLPLHGFESTELSPNDNFSKRKILLIGASSDPQSPTTLLKSTPKFRFFTLMKSKSVEKVELIGVSMESPEHKKTRKKSLREKIKVSVDLPVPSSASVYSMKEKQIGGKGVCKQLGKCRSTSAASSSPISRRDDSLLLQHDGIQSAILHCKKSLNSSRESSRLSRCTSDSSQEKLSNASSTDSSLSSRVTNNSSYEKLMDSARISREE
ncbi:hypothetical protein V6N13_032483 [Hibiscus sabdariffa]